jgi:hypothetical protein
MHCLSQTRSKEAKIVTAEPAGGNHERSVIRASASRAGADRGTAAHPDRAAGDTATIQEIAMLNSMQRRAIAGAATLFAAMTGSLAAAQTAPASFVVVHGIPGRAVGAGVDPLLPVDVLVAGKYCLLSGLTYGTIAGPFDVPPGTYPVAISLANPLAPCSNAPVISSSVTVTSGEFGAIVAAVSTSGAPTAEIYPVDVSTVPAGMQRFVTVHAADAPQVTVHAVSKFENASFQLAPGMENTSLLKTHDTFELRAEAGRTVLGPIKVNALGQAVVLTVAVGVAADGSATLISKVIPSVF